MANPARAPGAGQPDGVAPHGESPPAMPRWVKVASIIIGILVVLFIVLLLTGFGGKHGPGRHMSMGISTVTPTDARTSLALGDG